MESILFYSDGGHRDEATRRQVRSVAAQYSHRIGPRKRKQVKRTKTEEQDDKFKKIASVPPAAADDVAGGHAAAAGPSQPPPYFSNNHPPPPLAFVAQHPSHDAATPDSRPPGASTNAAGQLRWQPHWQPAPFGPGPIDGSQRPGSEGHPSQHIGPGPPPFQYPPQYPPQDQRQYQYPPPPPPHLQHHQRSESARAPPTAPISHTDYSAPRPQSQSASSSTAIRLPEYSWTEYPRYSPYHSAQSSTPSPDRRKPHDRPELPLPAPRRVPTPRSVPRNGEPPVPSPTLNGPDVFLRGRKNTPETERRLRDKEREAEMENTLTPIGQAGHDASRLHITKAPMKDLPPITGRSPRSAQSSRHVRQDSSLSRAPS